MFLRSRASSRDGAEVRDDDATGAHRSEEGSERQSWTHTRARAMTGTLSRPAQALARAQASPTRRRRRCVTTHAGKDGVLGKLSKLNPFKRRADAGGALERKRPSEEKKEFLSREVSEQIFGKGLMGKIAASAVNAAASSLGKSLADARDAADACYEDAKRAVRLDPEVSRALGGGDIQFGPVMQQSSMSVNGKTTTQIGFQCRGASGTAGFVRASSSDADGTAAVVQLSDGRTITVDSLSKTSRTASSSGTGNTYDEVFDISPDDVIDV